MIYRMAKALEYQRFSISKHSVGPNLETTGYDSASRFRNGFCAISQARVFRRIAWVRQGVFGRAAWRIAFAVVPRPQVVDGRFRRARSFFPYVRLVFSSLRPLTCGRRGFLFIARARGDHAAAAGGPSAPVWWRRVRRASAARCLRGSPRGCRGPRAGRLPAWSFRGGGARAWLRVGRRIPGRGVRRGWARAAGRMGVACCRACRGAVWCVLCRYPWR